MLIAEMLLLIALDDKGRIPGTVFPRKAVISIGLSGALLIELAIDGQLALADGGKLWIGEKRPCDELLADVYDAVRDHLNGRHAGVVIGGLSGRIGGSWHRVAGRLVRAGVLGRQRPWGVGPTRYPVLDPAARQAVLAQAWAAATSAGPPPSAAAVVLQLSGRCRARKRIAPDRRARIELLKLTLRMPQPPFSPDIAAAVEVLLSQVAALARRIDSGPGCIQGSPLSDPGPSAIRGT